MEKQKKTTNNKKSIINKYLSILHEQTIDCNTFGLIFRGQSNIEWSLASSAFRRIKNDKDGNEFKSIGNISNESFLKYNQRLIYRAREYGYGKNLKDLELLAEIQHYGGATCLLDFTSNFLVALWFASSDTSKDGTVHIINTNNVDSSSDKKKVKAYYNEVKDVNKEFSEIINFSPSLINRELKLIHIWKPTKIINRIYHQDSVFIFGYPLFQEITSSVIKIRKADKINIRRELKKYFKVDTETIFGDLQGFSLNANNYTLPIDDSFYLSCEELVTRSMNNNDYKTTLEYLNRIKNCNKDRDYCSFKRSKCFNSKRFKSKKDEFEYKELFCQVKIQGKEIENNINSSIETILNKLDTSNLQDEIRNLYDTLASYYYNSNELNNKNSRNKIFEKIINIYDRALTKHSNTCKIFEISIVELSIVINKKDIYYKYMSNFDIERINMNQLTYIDILYIFFYIIGNTFFESKIKEELGDPIPDIDISLNSPRWDFDILEKWSSGLEHHESLNDNIISFIREKIDKQIVYQEKNMKCIVLLNNYSS